MSVTLVAFTFFNTVLELARAPRTKKRQARSSVPRDRDIHLQLAFIAILVTVFGILMLGMAQVLIDQAFDKGKNRP